MTTTTKEKCALRDEITASSGRFVTSLTSAIKYPQAVGCSAKIYAVSFRAGTALSVSFDVEIEPRAKLDAMKGPGSAGDSKKQVYRSSARQRNETQR